MRAAAQTVPHTRRPTKRVFLILLETIDIYTDQIVMLFASSSTFSIRRNLSEGRKLRFHFESENKFRFELYADQNYWMQPR